MSFIGLIYSQDARQVQLYAQRLLNEQKIDSALITFNLAIKLNPNYAVSYRGRAEVYQKNNKFDLALYDLNKAIDLDANDLESYYLRANLFLVMNKFNKSKQDFDRLIKMESTYKNVLAQRGQVNSHLKNFKSAITDYETYLKFNPDDNLVLKNLFSIYNYLGYKKEAQSTIKKALSYYPDDYQVITLSAMLYLDKEVHEALRLLNRALEINPSYNLAYYIRAQLYWSISEKNNACQDFKKANELAIQQSSFYIVNRYTQKLIDTCK